MSDALTILGCGDAFGSGGRLQTCFHVGTRQYRFLIDCGATACIGMKRFGFDPLAVDAVLLTHFHADHCGGLPFLLIEAKMLQRSRPLALAGPPGLESRITAMYEALFPGSAATFPFPVEFIEYPPDGRATVGPVRVTAFPVVHVPETSPHALRVEIGNAVIACSGDTEWADALRDVARGADLFLCEAFALEGPIRIHLDYQTLARERATLECDRLVLTHMGPDVLRAADRIRADGFAEMADDGSIYRL
ncbi:MAG: MBL fold metallo-hydrolase [Gemmatimonadetes bacterium]|nr:MBL fold metallo-hydrolase [Gemmatimonadota bacterium]